MKTNNNIPAYRFQGYTDAWELRKLGEVGEIERESVNPKLSPNNIFEEYSMPSFDVNRRPAYVLGKEMLSSRLKIQRSSLLINKLNVRQQRIWLVETPSENAICSSEFMPFVSEMVNLEFLREFFLSNETTKKLEELSTGTSNSQNRVSPKDIINFKLAIPTLPEQEAIGTFFSTLDRHITLHQRKLDTLKEQKMTYLKLFFPAKGQTKPALRFQGFVDDWKEVKVSDIFQVTRGQVLSTNLVSDTKSDEYPYPVYSSQTKNNGLMGFYKDYLFDTAITWTTDGANAGTVRFREGKFYSTNVNGVLLSDEGYSNIAISEILNTVAWKYVSKVGNPKLMNNIMSEIILLIPGGFAEQQVLSSFFQTLDQEIAQVEDKLASLKEMKKTLLRKLFV
ncbi:restriction endonuclease subunit S [Streptococcus suis]|uniref:restriction endonuclease subunit S n=1 Tax=Streptococcus suis TaxID=1307 RepID=UPI001C975E38|nr:restriction endonuclease subunit S [Streptococcus suis]MBY5010070.1 restriction endonuclease subunit S [Streptococcus suis]